MKHKSFRNVICFILMLSILIVTASLSITQASGETTGVSGSGQNLLSDASYWYGDTNYTVVETGDIDTVTINCRSHGMGSAFNFSYSSATPYFDPKKSVIKLTKISNTSITTTGTVYSYYKSAHYCIVPITALGEFYLDLEAYDYSGNKYTGRIKVINQ